MNNSNEQSNNFVQRSQTSLTKSTYSNKFILLLHIANACSQSLLATIVNIRRLDARKRNVEQHSPYGETGGSQLPGMHSAIDEYPSRNERIPPIAARILGGNRPLCQRGMKTSISRYVPHRPKTSASMSSHPSVSAGHRRLGVGLSTTAAWQMRICSSGQSGGISIPGRAQHR